VTNRPSWIFSEIENGKISMEIGAYQKQFAVGKEFDLARFIEVLDDENFHPFLLFLEKASDHRCRGYFKNLKSLLPPFVGASERGNAADQMLLTKCTFEWLQSQGTIRITASISPNANLVISFLMVVVIAFVSGAIFMNSILAWIIPIGIIAFFLLLNYYWDAKRYDHIGKIANELTEHTKIIE
jgi:hypothetical protein